MKQIHPWYATRRVKTLRSQRRTRLNLNGKSWCGVCVVDTEQICINSNTILGYLLSIMRYIEIQVVVILSERQTFLIRDESCKNTPFTNTHETQYKWQKLVWCVRDRY